MIVGIIRKTVVLLSVNAFSNQPILILTHHRRHHHLHRQMLMSNGVRTVDTLNRCIESKYSDAEENETKERNLMQSNSSCRFFFPLFDLFFLYKQSIIETSFFNHHLIIYLKHRTRLAITSSLHSGSTKSQRETYPTCRTDRT